MILTLFVVFCPSAGMLSDRDNARHRRRSFTPPQCALLSRYCRRCRGFSPSPRFSLPPPPPEEDTVSHWDILSVTIIRDYILHTKLHLCCILMLRWSVRHAKTSCVDCTSKAPSGRRGTLEVTIKACVNSRKSKRRLNESLMDCCKMTVGALLMLRGIISLSVNFPMNSRSLWSSLRIDLINLIGVRLKMPEWVPKTLERLNGVQTRNSVQTPATTQGKRESN